MSGPAARKKVRASSGFVSWPCSVAGLLLAVLGWCGPARAVTVDGVVGSSEWGASKVIITDPNEADIDDNYDVHRIMMEDGRHRLYVLISVYGDYPELAAVETHEPYLNFYFNLAAGGADPCRFGITYNDGYGFSPGEMHLIQYGQGQGWRDVGEIEYAVDEAVEIAIPWTMFPPELIASPSIAVQGLFFLYNIAPGDANNDGNVDGADYTAWADHYQMTGAGWAGGDFNLNGLTDGGDYTTWADHYGYDAPGGSQHDMYDEYTMLDRSQPLTDHAPEPVTLLGVLLGLGGLGRYIRTRTRA